jgi:uncharacterized protein YkwD
MKSRILQKAGISLAVMIGISLVFALSGEGRERAGRSFRSGGRDIDIPRLEKKIHDLVNKERKKRGQTYLSWNDNLGTIARRYSKEMISRNFFSHNDPEGRSFIDRYSDAGFRCALKVGNTTCLGAENIAQDNLHGASLRRSGENLYGWNTEDEIAESIVKRWMGSKGHRENILTPYFKRQGIGVAISDDGKVFVTENFC